jgi:hypothetical protein
MLGRRAKSSQEVGDVRHPHALLTFYALFLLSQKQCIFRNIKIRITEVRITEIAITENR